MTAVNQLLVEFLEVYQEDISNLFWTTLFSAFDKVKPRILFDSQWLILPVHLIEQFPPLYQLAPSSYLNFNSIESAWLCPGFCLQINLFHSLFHCPFISLISSFLSLSLSLSLLTLDLLSHSFFFFQYLFFFPFL